jgi:hypothetical protein
VRVKGTDTLRSEKPPHALVFDPDGTCVFRGSAYDALPHARAAVGRSLLAKLNREEYAKAFAPVAEALTDGRPLLDVLPKLPPLVGSKDADTAADAKALHTALTAPGQEALAEAQTLVKSDPVAAFILVEKVPVTYKGTPLESKASALVASLRQTSAVGAELKARVLLEQVRKLDTALAGQPGAFNPTDPQFQARNAATLGQMRKVLDQMRKTHPKARATGQAEKIGRQYGVG